MYRNDEKRFEEKALDEMSADDMKVFNEVRTATRLLNEMLFEKYQARAIVVYGVPGEDNADGTEVCFSYISPLESRLTGEVLSECGLRILQDVDNDERDDK